MYVATASTIPIWKGSASAVNDKPPGITVEEVPLRKRNQGWSASYLIEKSLGEFNKKYKSMEQLLAYQPWDLCWGFIDAAAAEKLSQHLLGVYKNEGVTVQGTYDLGITEQGSNGKQPNTPEGPTRQLTADTTGLLPLAGRHPNHLGLPESVDRTSLNSLGIEENPGDNAAVLFLEAEKASDFVTGISRGPHRSANDVVCQMQGSQTAK
jgi:hypothetical protein